jgi:hypothetical protein
MLSTLVHHPWATLTWIGTGHTVACDQVRPSTWRHTSAVLVPAGTLTELQGLSTIALPNDRMAAVQVLVPISAEERRHATEKGSHSLLAGLPTGQPWWYVDR